MLDRVHLAVKATLAAVVAWLVARYGLGHPNPYWAPLAAVTATHPTVAHSVSEAVRYALAFGLGVGLATLISESVGPNVYGIAAVVFVSLLLASWGRLGQQRFEIPFAAVFVLLIGGSQVVTYATPRTADIVIGLPIGVIVNLTVFPPLHLRPATESLQRLRADLAALLEDMAYSLTQDWPPRRPTWLARARAMNEVLDQARRSVQRASESVQWNPRSWVGRGDYRMPRRAVVALNGLEHIAAAVRSIARTLSDAAQGSQTSDEAEQETKEEAGEAAASYSPLALQEEFRPVFADLLRRVAQLVRDHATPESPQVDRTVLDHTRDELRRLRQAVAEHEHTPRESWYAEGDLVIEMERILGELSDTSHTMRSTSRHGPPDPRQPRGPRWRFLVSGVGWGGADVAQSGLSVVFDGEIPEGDHADWAAVFDDG